MIASTKNAAIVPASTVSAPHISGRILTTNPSLFIRLRGLIFNSLQDQIKGCDHISCCGPPRRQRRGDSRRKQPRKSSSQSNRVQFSIASSLFVVRTINGRCVRIRKISTAPEAIPTGAAESVSLIRDRPTQSFERHRPISARGIGSGRALEA